MRRTLKSTPPAPRTATAPALNPTLCSLTHSPNAGGLFHRTSLRFRALLISSAYVARQAFPAGPLDHATSSSLFPEQISITYSRRTYCTQSRAMCVSLYIFDIVENRDTRAELAECAYVREFGASGTRWPPPTGRWCQSAQELPGSGVSLPLSRKPIRFL